MTLSGLTASDIETNSVISNGLRSALAQSLGIDTSYVGIPIVTSSSASFSSVDVTNRMRRRSLSGVSVSMLVTAPTSVISISTFKSLVTSTSFASTFQAVVLATTGITIQVSDVVLTDLSPTSAPVSAPTHKDDVGAIVGGVVGGFFGAVILVGVAYYYLQMKGRSTGEKSSTASQPGVSPSASDKPNTNGTSAEMTSVVPVAHQQTDVPVPHQPTDPSPNNTQVDTPTPHWQPVAQTNDASPQPKSTPTKIDLRGKKKNEVIPL